MKMKQERSAGLLLQSIPYLGKEKILKVLTPEQGLLSFLVKFSHSSDLTTPFLLGEWLYTKSRGELFFLKEGTTLNSFAGLKNSYAHLSAAGEIAQDLLKTQLPHKAAHAPYLLALAFFQKLPLFEKPLVLVASFRLKLLVVEGLLNVQELGSKEMQQLATSRSFQELASLAYQDNIFSEVKKIFEERFF